MAAHGDDHGWYGHTSSSRKVRPSSSKVAADSLLRASQAIEARVLNKLRDIEAEEATTGPVGQKEAAAQQPGQKTQYLYDRTNSTGQKQAYPYDRPGLGGGTGGSRGSGGVGSGDVGGSNATQTTDASLQQVHKGVGQQGAGIRDVLEEARQHARQAARSIPGVAQASAQRDKEARMLNDWFKAVWPDLGSFKMWGSATKVASMSGSLTLSLAFFGVVYWMSTKYDRGKEQKKQDDV